MSRELYGVFDDKKLNLLRFKGLFAPLLGWERYDFRVKQFNVMLP